MIIPNALGVVGVPWATIFVEKPILELPYTAWDDHDYVKMKIFGTVEDPRSSGYIYMTITKPDGDISKAKVRPSPADGEYSTFILICCNEVGKYTVSVEWHFNNIGTVTFNVVEKPLGSSIPTPIISSVTTNQSSYSKGETITVSGYINNYTPSNTKAVTITIKNPTGITAYFDQIQPTSDGQFSQAISTVNQLDESGQYAVTDMYGPDVPHHRKATRAGSDVYAAFISDIHIGSKTFLADAFSRFIDWLSNQHEDGSVVAERIRYLVIAGDVVDGVGVYPGQENDLKETNIVKQYDLFAEYISRIPKHIKVFVSPGNHDACRQALPQFAVSKEYAPKLYEMENVTMLGDPAVVRLHGSVVTKFSAGIPDPVRVRRAE